MALSEYEQRRLDEIDRAVHRDDPGFADAIDIGTRRRHRRLVAALVFPVGLLVLVAGAFLAQGLPLIGEPAGVLGFVVMVAGAGLILTGRPGRRINATDRDA
jgi:hypothetical protein